MDLGGSWTVFGIGPGQDEGPPTFEHSIWQATAQWRRNPTSSYGQHCRPSI